MTRAIAPARHGANGTPFFAASEGVARPVAT
jgi:hypothetical protein